MEDLIGVGISNSAEEPRIGEGALEGVVLRSKRGRERVEPGAENLKSTSVERVKTVFATDDVERRAFLRPRFREQETAIVEIKGGESALARQFSGRLAP